MTYEVWLFSRQEEYRPRGYVVAIEVCPPGYGRKDAEAYGSQVEEDYRASIPDVSHVIREERAY